MQSDQLVLFTVEQERQADGSFVVRPKAVQVEPRWISARKALSILGFRDIETIAVLVKAGEIQGWKPKTARGNGKWRIDWASVMAYKARREKAARED